MDFKNITIIIKKKISSKVTKKKMKFSNNFNSNY